MPNVIAIIDDAKIRSQIEIFLKELNEDGIRVRFFSTGTEFAKTYFEAKNAPKTHPLNKLTGLEKHGVEELDSVLATELVTKPSLPHPKVKLKINVKTMKVEAVEPALDANNTILGHFPEDFQAATDVLGASIPAGYKTRWSQFWLQIQSATASDIFLLKASDSGVGWFRLTGQRLEGDALQMEIQEITDTVREPIAAELRRRKEASEESDELKLLSEIDLVFFKVDCVEDKAPKWIEKTWKNLKDSGYFPKEKIPRFVLLKYEDDNISKLDVLHPRLDDLIYLPIDRLIFLQKLEIIFGLPKKVTPSILFTQEVNAAIEISKISKLEKLSDLGLVIRNPVRLKPGLLAHFFLTLPSGDVTVEIWGKVMRSEPHPERPHEHLVYFSFFGMAKKEAALIKRFVATSGKFHPFVNAERSEFLFNPDNIHYSEEEKRYKQVVILDLDEDETALLKGTITKDIDHIKCLTDTGYAKFITRHLNPAAAQLPAVVVATTESDIFAPTLSFVVNPENQELASALLAPSEGQTYFGHSAMETFASPKGWLKPILALPSNQEILTEMANLALIKRSVHRAVVAINAAGEGRIIRLSAGPSDLPDKIKIEMTLPQPEDVKSFDKNKADRLVGLNLVVVDHHLVPNGNVDAFIAHFIEQGQKSGVLTGTNTPKFIFLVDDDQKLDHRKFSNSHIVGLLAKPVDPRHLSFLTATGLEASFSVYNFANQGWSSTLLPIHVAKDVHLEAMSEFGASIRHSRPIAPGTVLYLRGGIFENAPNHCLAGRFYHCEEHPKEKGQYLCLLTYFGINDAFMKYARKWFRENYALSKQTEGQS